MFCIYGLCDPTTFEMRYAGQTRRELDVRLREHIKHAIAGRTHRDAWIRSLKVPPLIIQLEVVSSRQDLDQAEIAWIKRLRSEGHQLTNHTDGGSVPIFDEVTRKKLSIIASQKLLGRPVSEATREKLRIANSGDKCVSKDPNKRKRVRTAEMNAKAVATRRARGSY